MKKTSLKPSLRYKLFFLLFLFFNQANAQNIKRNIHLQFLEKDSVVFSFNPEYQLIEDSCAQIIRHAHYNRQTKKFSGRFQDIKKADPTMVLAEGSYSQEGFKNGSFISHYLNGNLQSKGTFENNKLVGRWELFYENGMTIRYMVHALYQGFSNAVMTNLSNKALPKFLLLNL